LPVRKSDATTRLTESASLGNDTSDARLFWKALHSSANVKLIRKLCHVEMHGDIVYLWPDRQQTKKLAPIVLAEPGSGCRVSSTMRILRTAGRDGG